MTVFPRVVQLDFSLALYGVCGHSKPRTSTGVWHLTVASSTRRSRRSAVFCRRSEVGVQSGASGCTFSKNGGPGANKKQAEDNERCGHFEERNATTNWGRQRACITHQFLSLGAQQERTKMARVVVSGINLRVCDTGGKPQNESYLCCTENP